MNERMKNPGCLAGLLEEGITGLIANALRTVVDVLCPSLGHKIDKKVNNVVAVVAGQHPDLTSHNK